ncbi:MAG: RecX family transcriptional regulator [Chlamydiia bacterium]|nr:RecX family transcriptional regulator [Chlamydiia bacterium]
MKIEIVNNKQFIDILVDGEEWKKVHKKLYKNHLREILQAPTKKYLSDLILRYDIKIGRTLVYKWLALRGFMKTELTKKLLAKKIDPRAIQTILSECEKLGYLDDQREGKLFIERGKRKGLGPQLLSVKLSQKAPELKSLPRTSFTDEEQEVLIKKWIEKKTQNSDFSDRKVKHRLYRFLLGKGFDEPLVRKELFVD